MKKVISLLLISVLILTTGCSLINDSSKQQSPTSISNNTNQNNIPAVNDSKPQAEEIAKPASDDVKKTSINVLIYMIALDDNGKSGKKLATGDSIIPVNRTLTDSKTPLKDSLNLLFSLKDRFYGQSGLYNALYQSSLKVDSAKIEGGVATVNISGNLKLGGTLDSPRVKAQIIETILQFSNVKEATVFLNGKTLDDALSLK